MQGVHSKVVLQGQGENMPTEAKARDRRTTGKSRKRAAVMWVKIQSYLDPSMELDTEAKTPGQRACLLVLYYFKLLSAVSHLKIDLVPFAKVQQATCMSMLLCEMEFISTTLLRDPRSICIFL